MKVKRQKQASIDSLHASWVAQGRFLPLRCLQSLRLPNPSRYLHLESVKRRSIHCDRGIKRICFTYHFVEKIQDSVREEFIGQDETSLTKFLVNEDGK
jgi:hypothetical protein